MTICANNGAPGVCGCAGVKPVRVLCSAHVMLHVKKNSAGVHGRVKSTMLQDVNNAVAHTASELGASVSVALMLDKWRAMGAQQTASAVQTYLERGGGLSTRVVANKRWTWGCPTTNNASMQPPSARMRCMRYYARDVLCKVLFSRITHHPYYCVSCV